jgi:hypothetical protein
MQETVMTHALQCECGTVKGFIAEPGRTFRGVCYCRDCQAFAHFLGRERDVLNDRGGSGVVQTVPRNVTFTQGADSLACMRLTSKGLLRWYSACCKTPIGNTMASYKLSFVGLVDACLRDPNRSLEQSFGPERASVYVEGARGEPKPRPVGQGRMIAWALSTILKARLNGDYRRTPFFRADTWQPIARPLILSDPEHARLMRSVLAALQGSR